MICVAMAIQVSAKNPGKQDLPPVQLAQPALAREHALYAVEGTGEAKAQDLLIERILGFGNELEMRPHESHLTGGLAKCRRDFGSRNEEAAYPILETLRPPTSMALNSDCRLPSLHSAVLQGKRAGMTSASRSELTLNARERPRKKAR